VSTAVRQPALPPKRPPRFYGATLADVFNAPVYNCSIADDHAIPEFAVTRLKSGPMNMQKAPAYPSDRALLACVALAPTAIDKWRARIGGKEVGVTQSIPFATTVIDLMVPMEMWAAGPFDYLHYYISRDLIDSVAIENKLAPVNSYKMIFFEEDLLIAQLTKSILNQVRGRELLSTLELGDISLFMSSHILQRYAADARTLLQIRRGLERWQKARIEEMVRARLTGSVKIAELATACQLSPSHFARCFRHSFGTSVRQWLIRLRLDRAKQLLRETKNSISEIALDSGFSDQAAFTRTFSRIEGATPFRWRKVNTLKSMSLQKCD
jgi:AraC family transcriptional regulator